MPTNPDFREAPEIVVPPNLHSGWGLPQESLTDKQYREAQGLNRLAADMPISFRSSAPTPVLPEMQKQFDEFQKSKGRFPGSYDWTLLDEFAVKTVLIWLPQIIGSCVVSNTFRAWVLRLTYQIVMLGLPMEYIGKNQFGPQNFAPYGPFSYGSARRRGNMRGSDGLYADVMAETLLKDGVLMCNTPALLAILNSSGNNKDKDFPEPQSESFYRAWGDWKYLDNVKQYADFTLQDCPSITNADTLKSSLEDGKPAFFCSGIAVKAKNTHKDGFTIHVRDPGNAWAHNMAFHGFFLASDGNLFYRFSNESWGTNHLYNVPYDEVVSWFKNRQPSSFAIGTINGPKSSPPVIQ